MSDLEILVLNRQRKHKVVAGPLQDYARRMAEKIDESEDGFSIVLLSDRSMKEYNRRYRNVARTTDVLAFPSGSSAETPETDSYLGDILISVETALRQAEELGGSLAQELRTLILHGYLHLLGYDHETDGGEMMRRQRRLERELAHGQ